MAGANAVALLASVHLGQGADAGSANVQVASHRGASHIEPVDVHWSQLVEGATLYQVVPDGNLELASPVWMGDQMCIRISDYWSEIGKVR